MIKTRIYSEKIKFYGKILRDYISASQDLIKSRVRVGVQTTTERNIARIRNIEPRNRRLKQLFM